LPPAKDDRIVLGEDPGPGQTLTGEPRGEHETGRTGFTRLAERKPGFFRERRALGIVNDQRIEAAGDLAAISNEDSHDGIDIPEDADHAPQP
jgi:hypothetical protein